MTWQDDLDEAMFLKGQGRHELRRHDASMQVRREAVATYRAVGAGDPALVKALENLAMSCRALDLLEEADALAAEAWEGRP